MTELELTPLQCTVFFSFLVIRCQLPLGAPRPLSVVLLRDGQEASLERQLLRTIRPAEGVPPEFELQAMIDRDAFPDSYALQIGFRGESVTVPCRAIVYREQALHARSIMTPFLALLEEWHTANPGRRPALLDIGGRARSGNRHGSAFDQCDVTVTDIIADESVDMVTDIHRMSADLGAGRFEFALCISVFEHLLMPWKAVLEINKVLKPGGLILVQTHQTVGMHDTPWDYYRFSDESWKGLFNRYTGFQIEHTLMSNFQHIIPLHYYGVYPGFEGAGGFNDSAVIARKTASTLLEWPVELRDIIQSNYPA
jgi:SAM-dependent methyltransferase